MGTPQETRPPASPLFFNQPLSWTHQGTCSTCASRDAGPTPHTLLAARGATAGAYSWRSAGARQAAHAGPISSYSIAQPGLTWRHGRGVQLLQRGRKASSPRSPISCYSIVQPGLTLPHAAPRPRRTAGAVRAQGKQPTQPYLLLLYCTTWTHAAPRGATAEAYSWRSAGAKPGMGMPGADSTATLRSLRWPTPGGGERQGHFD